MITGIDFGRWTEWRRKANTPRPVYFAIVGISSGKWDTKTFNYNLPAILNEKRKLVYHFYDAGVKLQSQLDKFAKNADKAQAQSLWWDYERWSGHKLNERTAHEALAAVRWLEERFNKAGLYSNGTDYIRNFQDHVGVQDARSVDLWYSYPDKNPDNHPRFVFPWGKVDRPEGSYTFDQFSWHGDAQAYGATNSKSKMDEDTFNGTLQELDQYLGIDHEEPEPQPDKDFYFEKIIELANKGLEA